MTVLSSLSGRLYGGFIAVLAMILASTAITMLAIDSLRASDHIRAEAFSHQQYTADGDDLLSNSRLQIANYLIANDAASQKAADEALAVLKDRLQSLVSDTILQRVDEHGHKVTEAGFRRLQASQDLVAAMGALGNPITILAELGTRAGGTTAQLALEPLISFSRLNAATARFGENEAERFVTESRDETKRLTETLTALERAPETTARMQRLIKVSHEKLQEGQAAFDQLLVAAQHRKEARNALEMTLSIAAGQIDAHRSETEAAFTAAEADSANSLSNLSRQSLGSGAAAAVLGIIMVWLIGRSITRPILSLQAGMQRIADGALDAPAPEIERRDEIGVMARVLDQFRQSLAAARQLEIEDEARREAAALQRQVDLQQLATGLEVSIGTVVQELRKMVSDLAATSEQLSLLSATTNREINGLGNAATGAARNVESLAAASEELATSISEVGRSAASGSSTTRDVTDEADAAETHMRTLAETAERVGGVVDVISTIARHTNLLALNAMIESARAGTAGSGFAVVAGEVKNLAHQTATATDDIQRQIQEMQQMTKAAAGAIQGVIERVRGVDSAVANIAAAVEQQQATTGEIARSAQNAAVSADHVRSNISQIALGAADTDRAATAVRTAADMLRERSDQLGRDLTFMVQQLRAG